MASKSSATSGFPAWILLGLLSACAGCAPRASPPRVGIVSIIEHPLLEQSRMGFIDALADAGYRDGDTVRLDYRNAQGRMENASTIAASFVGNQVQLIYSVSTPATLAAKERTTTIPVVFAAVTNPVAAGIVASEALPNGNVTGVSDRVPIDQLFATIRKLLPHAKFVGLPYNAGEANSVAQVAEMRRLAAKFDLNLVETTAANTAEVSQAVSALVGKVDVIYMMADNTMAAAANVIADIAQRNRIPFVSCEDGVVKEGKALASLVIDHYKMGRLAGAMAVRILSRGERPGQIPVTQINDFALTLNLSVARELNVQLQADVVAGAAVIP